MGDFSAAEREALYPERKISADGIAVASVEACDKDSAAAPLQNIRQRYSLA